MFTIKEPLSQHRLRLFHHRHHRTYCTLRKINAGHRLINLQRSRLAGLGINMVPVVKTKRHVAVFLHFKNHKVAQRVNGPGWQEDAVARFWPEAGQMVRHGPVCDRPPQNVCRGGWFQARVDKAFRPRLQHHPCFGLAALARRQIFRLLIRWMHLDREHVPRVEELQQQREPAEAPGQFSQQLLRPLFKQLPDGPSFERSIGDATADGHRGRSAARLRRWGHRRAAGGGVVAGADWPRCLCARIAGIPVEIPPLGSYRTGVYFSRFDDSVLATEEEVEARGGVRS